MALLNGRQLTRARQTRADRTLDTLATHGDIIDIADALVVNDPTASTQARDLFTVATLRTGRRRAFVQFAVHLATPAGPPKPGARFTTPALMLVAPQITAAVEDGRLPTVLTGGARLERIWQRYRLLVAALLRDRGSAVDCVLAAALELHDPGPRPAATPLQPPTDIRSRMVTAYTPASPQVAVFDGAAMPPVPAPATATGRLAPVINLHERRALRVHDHYPGGPGAA